MRDARGVIIYVGKAKNLRHRVLGYFRPGARHAPKVRSMVNTVADFEFMTVKNEAEALLTEASLIKKYKPHFNILMRDDKRYLALRADPSSEFPAFATCRIIRDDGALYFGPFPSAPVVRAAKDFVEKHYGLRGCKCISPDADHEMIQILLDQRLNGKIPFFLHAIDIDVAHKTGEDSGTTHDVAIVMTKTPFVLCFASNDTDVARFERLMQDIALELAVANNQ
jgi:hypothetical protein